MKKVKDKLLHIEMPHTYVILVVILLIVVAMAWVIPSGVYDRIPDESSGKMVVLPGSFHFVEGVRPGFFDIFRAIQRGYVSAANILFLIVFAYSYVYLLTESGTLHASIQVLVRLLGDRTHLVIPVFMILFGLLGATLGIFEETYGLIPVFIGFATALGYDQLVGGAMVYVGVATGFAAALTNPFSVGIAQSIAELPLNSGLWYRAVIFLVFQGTSIWYVMRYARRVKADPTKSVLYREACEAQIPAPKEATRELTLRQKLCLLLFVVTIGTLIYGTTQSKWYIDEIAAMFLMMMAITGVVAGYSATQICKTFIDATKSVVPSILVIGFTRGILLTMQDAMIADTIVYELGHLLNYSNKALSAVGMLILQNIINFFIDGSSSQATITMPIMAPVADIVGLSRQTAVLCYCFGDGFSDMFWPTNCSLQCGLMGVPINRWYRFIAPLFLIMLILQIFFIIISVYIY